MARGLFKCLFTCLMISATEGYAASTTWIAQSPDNDIENASNWSSGVPSGTDSAIFNSAIPGISTNPTENSTSFTVLNINFPQSASAFTFHFDNQSLIFTGTGITGQNTNTTILSTNINNNMGDMIVFSGPSGTSGSANITSANSASLTGNQSGAAIGLISFNLASTGPFSVATGGTLSASNIGNDSATGTGSNLTAIAGSSQLNFIQSFTAGDNVTVSAANNATFSGTNSGSGDLVGFVNGSQFISAGAFQVGDNFTCLIQNSGNDSGQSDSTNTVGQLNGRQMELQSSAVVGNNCSITITDSGNNSSQSTGFPDFIGYLNDQQFIAQDTFQAGNDFSLNVSLEGVDSSISTGTGGAQVGVINSNSGTTGEQVLLFKGASLGNDASINVTLSGTYSGSNSNGGSNIASTNHSQFAAGDSTSVDSYSFSAGNNFNLTVTASGTDSAVGFGNEAVGNVSTNQSEFFTPCLLGDNAQLTITKSGNYSGNGTNNFVTIGSAGGSQLTCLSSFQAGDNYVLNVHNSGVNTATGIGNNFIGILSTGQQAAFLDGLTLGNSSSITIVNSGTNSSNTTAGNNVAALLGYGKQMRVEGIFQAGDNLQVAISNSASDNSTGAASLVGFINNNVADGTASQLQMDAGIIGNNATFAITNSGTYQASNTGVALIAVLAGQQFKSTGNFQTGDAFSFTVTNSGVDNASGQTSKSIGTVGGTQVDFAANCLLGNSSSIITTNSGVNNDVSGTNNAIGFVNGSQINVGGNFQAGTNLSFIAENSADNKGDASNFVGRVIGSQINFVGQCQFSDASVIKATNSGTVTNSQITFGQGFDILSGKATITAINTGTVGTFGIDVQGSNAGGNAEIFLTNSSLNIQTSLPTFTIGGLNGDSTSTAQSLPTLIINTDETTNAVFQGVIQDYTATQSALTKDGPGIQTLSGNNTYTGLTTVQRGTLILNGSVAGDVLVNPRGILKGNGVIAGNLTNLGTIAPGQGIGTLTVLSNFVNDSGNYEVEVNGLGQSDLINVVGTTTLNGGTVIVSTVDGLYKFQQPYTIVTSAGGVTGTFSRAVSLAFITPILTYDPNHVYLTIESDLVRAADSCNQYGVARSLDSIVDPDVNQTLLLSTIANLSLNDAQDALESLSGYQYTNDVWMTEISTRRFLRRLYDPLRSLVSSYGYCSPCEQICDELTGWIETDGNFAIVHGKNAHKLEANCYEVTAGIQKNICKTFTLGLAGCYEYDHLKYKNGKGNRNSELVAAYGLYKSRCYYGLCDFVYGHTSNNFNRDIHVGEVRNNAHSKFDLNFLAFYAEAGFVGFNISECSLLVQPFVGLQIDKNWRNKISEKGAHGLDMTVNRHEWASTSSRLGLHLSTYDTLNCMDLSLDIAWNQLLSNHKNSAKGRFNLLNDDFHICGNNLDRASIDYAFTVSSWLDDCLKGYIELSGETWHHATTVDILCGVEFTW